MAYGIINMGQGIKQNVMSSFSELAKQEQQQNLAEDQMKRQQDAAKSNTIGTTAGMGLQSDMSKGGGLTKEAWNESFGGGEAPKGISQGQSDVYTQDLGSLKAQNFNNVEMAKDLETASANARTYSDAVGNGMRSLETADKAQKAGEAINTAGEATKVGADTLQATNAMKDAKLAVDGANAVASGTSAATATAGTGATLGTSAAAGTAASTAATTGAAATTVSAGSAAASGAQAGASFGPWGALAGAAIGYLITSLF